MTSHDLKPPDCLVDDDQVVLATLLRLDAEYRRIQESFRSMGLPTHSAVTHQIWLLKERTGYGR